MSGWPIAIALVQGSKHGLHEVQTVVELIQTAKGKEAPRITSRIDLMVVAAMGSVYLSVARWRDC